MIYLKTKEEIELLRQSNLVVSKTLGYIASLLKVGVKTSFLDSEAEKFIRDHKGVPAFKGYRGFPSSLCISVNDAVVHGIPSGYVLKDTDIVSIDCGVGLNGFVGDCAYTFAFKNVPSDVIELLRITNRSLYIGIEKAVVGCRVGDIGYAIQDFVERKNPYGIVRELVGHGVGRSLHEEPDVPNFGLRGRGIALKEGMVLAIEPMATLGGRYVKQDADGWSILTRDGKSSAHFEHSVAVGKDRADILSTHDFIIQSIKNNSEVVEI